MWEQSQFPSLHTVTSELADLTTHLWTLTAPCYGTNGLQELPVSCNHLGSGLNLHLYKDPHLLLLTCGILYSAAKLVNSCNQIAALLTACTKVNNTSIFQCPASSLMTLLAVLVGTFSDITNSGTAKTIVLVPHRAPQLIQVEEGGCPDSRLPMVLRLQCPAPWSPHAVVWWLARETFTLTVSCASCPGAEACLQWF